MDAGPHLLDTLVRIQIEYVDMPQLRLTLRQAERLWGLSSEVCQTALGALLRTGFLTQAADGAYVRGGMRRLRAQVQPHAA